MAEYAFIDSHTHLSTQAFHEGLEETLARARAAGIQEMIAIGAAEGFQSNQDAVDFAAKHELAFATVGLHPHDAKLFDEAMLSKLHDLARSSEKVVAWGEIGLDYHYMHSTQEVQERAFVEQILLAGELQLPIVIHTREAEADTLRLLRQYRDKISAMIFHCFTGDRAFAREIDSLGAYIGVGGVLTFPNAGKIREAVASFPLERILLETDCPYLAPVPHRGKRNEPAFVPLIAQKLAEITGQPLEQIALHTTANARRFFQLPMI